MEIIELTTPEQFKSLVSGDLLIVEFKKKIYPLPHKINSFRIYDNKESDSEIILQKKNNIWFNWRHYLEGRSYHVIRAFQAK